MVTIESKCAGIFFCDGFDTALKPRLGTRGLYLKYLQEKGHANGGGLNLDTPVIVHAIDTKTATKNTALRSSELDNNSRGTILVGLMGENGTWESYWISVSDFQKLSKFKNRPKRCRFEAKDITKENRWCKIDV